MRKFALIIKWNQIRSHTTLDFPLVTYLKPTNEIRPTSRQVSDPMHFPQRFTTDITTITVISCQLNENNFKLIDWKRIKEQQNTQWVHNPICMKITLQHRPINNKNVPWLHSPVCHKNAEKVTAKNNNTSHACRGTQIKLRSIKRPSDALPEDAWIARKNKMNGQVKRCPKKNEMSGSNDLPEYKMDG
jgi:hypothetical protein